LTPSVDARATPAFNDDTDNLTLDAQYVILTERLVGVVPRDAVGKPPPDDNQRPP
jgi:hypothetical protein